MIVGACATTSGVNTYVKPSSPCPQFKLQIPLVEQLINGYEPANYPESKEVCDVMEHRDQNDYVACLDMFHIMNDLISRERCYIEYIKKYDATGLFED